MSVTLEGASPAYVPARVPADPDPNPQAQATRQQQIEAQIRAQILAARKAQEELERAQKAQQENQDKAKARQLQADVEAKQKLAQQKWADLKATVKERIEADGPKGRAKATELVKTMSDDGRYKSLVDEAAKEKPDVKTAATGNADADAAARRVAGAYAKGGDVEAARALRAELEAAKTPADRAAIMKASMPVVDRVAGDVGMNARRGADDWGKDGYEPGGNYTTDLDGNPNPIDSREEFDYTVADLNAALQTAGDKSLAFHVANKLLQVMPAGDGERPDATNLLGLLGQDLGKPSAGDKSILAGAVAAVLIDPDRKGPAGTELALGIADRDRAARLLAPDMVPEVFVEDWSSSNGVRHDGTVWHEASRNPDLFLTQKQQADLAKKTEGWTPEAANTEKTAQAVRNLRAQHPDRDLDEVDDGERFEFDSGDPRPAHTPPLDKAVQAEVDKSKGGHPNDVQYADDLDALTDTDAFRKMGAEQQVAALGQYDRTWTQAAKGKAPLDADDKAHLKALITSPSFHAVNPRVQERLLGLYSEFAKNDPGRLDKLQKLVDSESFKTLDDEATEFKVLDAYQHDGHYRDKVDALAAGKLPPADQKMVLGMLTHVATERQRYTDGSDGDKAKIMDSAYEMFTSERFRRLDRAQQISAENYLTKKGDEEYGLDKGGAGKALDKAEKDKLQNLGNNPGFISMGSVSDQIHALESYRGDEFYRNKIDALAGDNALSADDKKNAFVQIDRIGHDTRYTVNTTVDKKHLMDRAYAMVTSDRFRKLSPQQRDVARNDLLDHRLDPHGDTNALDKAEKAKTADLATGDRPGHRQPAGGPHDEKSVRAEMAQLEADAPTVATAYDTVNDDLRRVAGDDPVTYAYLALSKSHAGDKQYLALLKSAAVTERRDYTTQHVADLMKQGKADEALKVLKTNMDAASDPAERQKIFDQAGKPAFTPEVMRDQLDAAVKARGKGGWDEYVKGLKERTPFLDNGKDPVGELLKTYGDQAPPELANQMLDIVVGKMKDSGSDFFKELREDTHASDATHGDIYAGLSQLVERADSFGGYRAAEVAKLLKTQVFSNDPNDYVSRSTRTDAGTFDTDSGLDKGIRQAVGDHGAAALTVALYNEYKADPALQVKNSKDDKIAGQLNLRDQLADSLGDGIDKLKDNAKSDLDAWQKKNADALRLIQEYGTVDQAQVAKAIYDHRSKNPKLYAGDLSDKDDKGVDELQRNMEQRGVQLDTLMRDLGSLQADLDHTDIQQEKDLKGAIEGLDGDEAAMSTLGNNVTLQQQLTSQINFGTTDASVNQIDPIRDNVKSVGTTTSVTRLTKNFIVAAGDNVLQAYGQAQMRRGLKDIKAFKTDSALVINAARLMGTDKASVDKVVKFMEEWKSEVAKAGTLSPAHKLKFAQEFNQKFPDGDFKLGRPARLLGAACFFGSGINNATQAWEKDGVDSTEAFAGLFMAGGLADLYRTVNGPFKGEGQLADKLSNSSFGQYAKSQWGITPEKMSKFLKDNTLGALITLGDIEWAIEDFKGEPLWQKDSTGEGSMTKGMLTTGIVAGDLIEMGGGALRTQAGRNAARWMALRLLGSEVGAAAVSEGWAGPVGWIGTGISAAFLTARFAVGVTEDKNKFEYNDNPGYREMVKSLGFTDDQARELMNENGGKSDIEPWKGWGWVPGGVEFGEVKSFFTEGGVGPMHVLNPLFDDNTVPPQQRLQYLQSLTPDEIHKLVKKTHEILDDDMLLEDKDGKKAGTIPDKSLVDLKQWMKDNGVWKPEYLG